MDAALPETGHTALIEKEHTVELRLDGGWSAGLLVSPQTEGRPLIIDMDPMADPTLIWSGKRTRRTLPILPLQKNEVVSESRIARIVNRARLRSSGPTVEGVQAPLFAELEKTLRESDKAKRIELYTHDEGWTNKLICGDSLSVMESLMSYERLRGQVHMIYIDPPYGIKYDSNFQQRIDSTKNDDSDRADDVLTIRAYNDIWQLGIHSYLSHLAERLYVAREMLRESGSIFVQIGDEHVHEVRALMDEVFGAGNFMAQIPFRTKIPLRNKLLAGVCDYLIWYANDKPNVYFQKIFSDRGIGFGTQFTRVELPGGKRRPMSEEELDDPTALPEGSRVYRLIDLNSSGLTPSCVFDVEFEGRVFPPRTGHSWKTNPVGMQRLIEQRRVEAPGETLQYVFFFEDFPYIEITNLWSDTQGAIGKRFAVQTSEKVVERCILMATRPGDLVLDITCGSGVTALCSERWGRRWITCDTSRVAINVARTALLSSVFNHYQLLGDTPSAGFSYAPANKVTLGSLSNDREAAEMIRVDRPDEDPGAIRVTGPFDILTLGRYSTEDWKGYLIEETDKGRREENYITVIARLYRKNAGLNEGSGVIHAVAQDEHSSIGIAVGPISGRVTARQIYEAAREGEAAGLDEVHVLGWAFEANVGEVKSKLDVESKTRVALVMIRPDTLAEGLKITRPETLFSPMAIPDIHIDSLAGGQLRVTLKGVGVFDRSRRTTTYKTTDSGYISAWYLDEDYDGDCIVDCQMFFDFKRKSKLQQALGVAVDAGEWRMHLSSEPFKAGKYKRIAVKVVDVFGNESTVVRTLD